VSVRVLKLGVVENDVKVTVVDTVVMVGSCSESENGA